MLLGNYSTILKSPCRFMGGTSVSDVRSAWTAGGAVRNLAFAASGDAGWKLQAKPQGFYPPGAWMLPLKAGGMTSRREVGLAVDAVGSGALGRGMAGAATISLGAVGLGGLIAGGVGTAPITISATGAIRAAVSAPGAATISVGASAAIGAIGWLQGQATISVGGVATSYAIGHMAGTTEEQGLSVSGITNALLAALLATQIPVDVQAVNGETVYGVGSDADPWREVP